MATSWVKIPQIPNQPTAFSRYSYHYAFQEYYLAVSCCTEDTLSSQRRMDPITHHTRSNWSSIKNNVVQGVRKFVYNERIWPWKYTYLHCQETFRWQSVLAEAQRACFLQRNNITYRLNSISNYVYCRCIGFEYKA